MPDCYESPPRQLLQAFGEFNRGDWFECHETLEDLWLGEQGEMRDFYQGILQVAVALHHWRNGNFKGAVSLLEGGAAYLHKVSAVCQRIDVAGIIEAAGRMRDVLIELGPDNLKELPENLIPKLRLVSLP